MLDFSLALLFQVLNTNITLLTYQFPQKEMEAEFAKVRYDKYVA